MFRLTPTAAGFRYALSLLRPDLAVTDDFLSRFCAFLGDDCRIDTGMFTTAVEGWAREHQCEIPTFEIASMKGDSVLHDETVTWRYTRRIIVSATERPEGDEDSLLPYVSVALWHKDGHTDVGPIDDDNRLIEPYGADVPLSPVEFDLDEISGWVAWASHGSDLRDADIGDEAAWGKLMPMVVAATEGNSTLQAQWLKALFNLRICVASNRGRGILEPDANEVSLKNTEADAWFRLLDAQCTKR